MIAALLLLLNTVLAVTLQVRASSGPGQDILITVKLPGGYAR
jgi:hypothetical protein